MWDRRDAFPTVGEHTGKAGAGAFRQRPALQPAPQRPDVAEPANGIRADQFGAVGPVNVIGEDLDRAVARGELVRKTGHHRLNAANIGAETLGGEGDHGDVPVASPELAALRSGSGDRPPTDDDSKASLKKRRILPGGQGGGAFDNLAEWNEMTDTDTIFSQDLHVFGVGLPKTGLTSLARVMETIGCDAGGREGQARRAFFVDQDYQKVLALYEMGRFVADGPTCLMYKVLYEKYGRSARFVLTVRRDADTWFASLKRHNLYAGVKNKHRWIFGRFYPHGFDDELKAYYERHNAEVTAYFAERGASDLLLTLCCSDADALQKLSDFLGVEFPVTQFPKENVSTKNRPGLTNHLKKRYNRIVQAAYAAVAPRLAIRLRPAARPIEPQSLTQ